MDKSVIILIMMHVLFLNVGVYLWPSVLLWPSVQNACICDFKVWLEKKWLLLFYSTFTHSNVVHSCINTALFFIWKANTLEKHFGSAYFFYMVVVLTALTWVVCVGIGVLMANDLTHLFFCTTVGFSSVLFAVNVLATDLQPPGWFSVISLSFPTWLDYTWKS